MFAASLFNHNEMPSTQQGRNGGASTIDVDGQSFNAEKRVDMQMVDPRLIDVAEGFNKRREENFGDMERLKRSILKRGVKVPLWGRRNGVRYIVTDGHRRLRAVMELIQEGHNIQLVPFRLEPKGYTQEDRMKDILTMNDQQNLAPEEKAELFADFIALGFTPQQIAEESGESLASVEQLLQYNAAPRALKNLVEDDKISAHTAIALVREAKQPDGTIDDAKLRASAGAVAKAASEGNKRLSETKAKQAAGIAAASRGTMMQLLKDILAELDKGTHIGPDSMLAHRIREVVTPGQSQA